MSMFQRGAGMFNTLLRPVLGAPVVGKFLSGSLAEVTYVGRKSGRRVELLVAYKRRSDEVLIAVAMPDKKTWWRNFYPDGGQIGSVGDPASLFVGEFGRLRTVVVAPDGALWFTTSNRDGRGDPRPGDDRILAFRP